VTVVHPTFMPWKEGAMAKVWFITGSSRGLGRELVKAVLDAGDRVVATARKPEELRELVENGGDRVRAVALDVTDSSAARSAIASAVAAFERIDVVVNNAGYANVSSIEDMAEDDFRAQVETNFFGVVNVTRAALPVLRAQGSGHFIQISSIGGRRAGAGLSAYQSSKFAVDGFSEALSKEVAPLGIRVTIVEPGGIRTDWAGSSMRVDAVRDVYESTVGVRARTMREHADEAHGDPAKMAKAIVAIAAEENPPVRLLLGSDAVYLASIAARERAEEDAKWKSVSLSTDYDGMIDFAETPIAKMLVPKRS
jgi:NAD(P)-dependent dehydrogenase (short-subunit alcohol dehydrogenase family)